MNLNLYDGISLIFLFNQHHLYYDKKIPDHHNSSKIKLENHGNRSKIDITNIHIHKGPLCQET
jgi:hypothetical protein